METDIIGRNMLLLCTHNGSMVENGAYPHSDLHNCRSETIEIVEILHIYIKLQDLYTPQEFLILM